MHAALLALLPVLALATSVDKRWTASPDVGSTTTDLFPPTGSEWHLVFRLCFHVRGQMRIRESLRVNLELKRLLAQLDSAVLPRGDGDRVPGVALQLASSPLRSRRPLRILTATRRRASSRSSQEPARGRIQL